MVKDREKNAWKGSQSPCLTKQMTFKCNFEELEFISREQTG